MNRISDSLIQDIQAEAECLGFSLFGTSPVKPLSADRYLEWLRQGHHAGMKYLARPDHLSKRIDPHLIYAPAQTALVFAFSYPAPYCEINNHLTGRIASYAWHLDYHTVIRARLDSLSVKLQAKMTGIHFSPAFTDSAPILERDLALQAGIGWFGKNSCLINPKIGSTFFLAVLFCDLEMEPITPIHNDYCGCCKRCITICPTGCIQNDRTINAARCISYLTIEHKDLIPQELRSKMGNWIFGCDLCQQVCPWNERFAPRQVDPAFSPLPDFTLPELITELQLSQEAFEHKFQNSPIRRPHRRGYLRNVAIALGNSHDSAGIAALQAVLQNEAEPLIRGAAAWALHQLPVLQAGLILHQAKARETDLYVLSEINLETDSESLQSSYSSG